MKSKLILKIEQHFEDGFIVDRSKEVDNLRIHVATNGFGHSVTDSGQNVKETLLKELRKELFKTECEIVLDSQSD
jgi:hypothetical protein